jgi:quercetin dioxygenase-like cupin family protein
MSKNSPAIAIACVENLYSRMMQFKNAGDIEHGHCHTFDHLTLLASGKLQVRIGEQVTEYTAPYMIYIHKDVNHELTALADNTVAYCIHALRDEKTGNILDPKMIPNGVNARDIAQPIVALTA